MSKCPFSAASWTCKGAFFIFVVREGMWIKSTKEDMRSFIGSISSVRNLTMWRPPLQQLKCNGVHPLSSRHRGSTYCSVTRYLTISRWTCSVASWSGVVPWKPRHAGLQFLSSMKYLSMSKLPPCAAAWRAVSRLSKVDFGALYPQEISRSPNSLSWQQDVTQVYSQLTGAH